MDQDCMQYTQSIQYKQCETILHALNNEELSDATFIIGQNSSTYHVNRIFLALISPVFKAMLFGSMKESQFGSEVIIKDVQPNAFESILKFAYCNDPQITASNVLLLISCADKYQINGLLDLCYAYFTQCLTNDNFSAYFVQAAKLKILNHTISNIMEQYVIKNAVDILNARNFCELLDQFNALKLNVFVNKCEEFLQQCPDSMIRNILESEYLVKMSLSSIRILLAIQPLECREETLWHSVLKWAIYQSNVHNNSVTDYKKTDKWEDYKIYLLKSIRDLIRFGLMNPDYFVQCVEPQKVLTDKEVLCVLLYYHQYDRGCGSFNTSLRRSLQQQRFIVKMSSKYEKCCNTFESLNNTDLSDGCGTDQDENMPKYIQACFDGKTVNVMKIEIGAASEEMSGKWGAQYLNGAMLQQYKSGGWVDILQLCKIEEGSVNTLEFKFGEIRTTSLCIYKDGGEWLGLGCWRIFGLEG